MLKFLLQLGDFVFLRIEFILHLLHLLIEIIDLMLCMLQLDRHLLLNEL